MASPSGHLFLQHNEMPAASVAVQSAQVNQLNATCTVALLIINCVPRRAPVFSYEINPEQEILRVDWDDGSLVSGYYYSNSSTRKLASGYPKAVQWLTYDYPMTIINARKTGEALPAMSPTVTCNLLPGLPRLTLKDSANIADKCLNWTKMNTKGNPTSLAILTQPEIYWISPSFGIATWLSPLWPEKIANISSTQRNFGRSLVTSRAAVYTNELSYPRMVALYDGDVFTDALKRSPTNVNDTYLYNGVDGRNFQTQINARVPVVGEQRISCFRQQTQLPRGLNYSENAASLAMKPSTAYMSYDELNKIVFSATTILLGRAYSNSSDTRYITILNCNAVSEFSNGVNWYVDIEFTQPVTSTKIKYSERLELLAGHKSSVKTLIWGTRLSTDVTIDPVSVTYTVTYSYRRTTDLIEPSPIVSQPLYLPTDIQNNRFAHGFNILLNKVSQVTVVDPSATNVALLFIEDYYDTCINPFLGLTLGANKVDNAHFLAWSDDIVKLSCQGSQPWCNLTKANMTATITCI